MVGVPLPDRRLRGARAQGTKVPLYAADGAASGPDDLAPRLAFASFWSRPAIPATSAAAARAMLTMGLTRLVLVDPLRFPHAGRGGARVGRRRGARSRAGGRARSTRPSSDARSRSACRRGRASSPAACCRYARRPRPPSAHADHGDVALVFGTEMSGLSNDELARCGVVATIPTNPDYASLNLAAAVQVACYELRVALTGDRVWQRAAVRAATTDEIAAPRRPRRAHAGRCASSIRGCRAAACRGCGGCSRAPVSRRRKSTSCAASSRASTRRCGDERRVLLVRRVGRTACSGRAGARRRHPRRARWLAPGRHRRRRRLVGNGADAAPPGTRRQLVGLRRGRARAALARRLRAAHRGRAAAGDRRRDRRGARRIDARGRGGDDAGRSRGRRARRRRAGRRAAGDPSPRAGGSRRRAGRASLLPQARAVRGRRWSLGCERGQYHLF